MGWRAGQRRLHGEQARRAVQGHTVKESGIHREPGRQRAINAGRTALTGFIAMQGRMQAVRRGGRRFVTGWMGCRSGVRDRFGGLHNRHGKRAIGRAGDGKAKHDQGCNKRAHGAFHTRLPRFAPVTDQ